MYFVRIKLFVVVVAVFLFFNPASVFAAADPILWLKFDDGSGTTPQDSGSNNLDGSFTSTVPTWSANVPDVAFSNPYSLLFAGSGDGVTVSWPAELDFGATDPRSFSFWYKPTANGEGQYSRIISWSNDRLEIAGTEAGPTTHKITYFDGNWHATDITLSIGTWYHVTFTYDGTTAKFYIGDELQDEHSLAGRALSGTLRIGNRVQQLDEGINGNIDDVRIYNYALSQTQVANLAAGSSDPDSAPDETAPVISDIASTTSSTGASITWTTNEAASTKVVYSVNTQYASSTSETDTSTRVTSHTKSLTSLLSCTTYNFRAVSGDAAGNYATSSAASFTTSGCAGGALPTSATSTSVTVSGAATSTLTDNNRSITVVTPANFTTASSSVVIQVKGLSSDTVLGSIGKPSSSLSSASSVVFNVTALVDSITELDSFDVPVTVSFTYTDGDVSGLTESTLRMFHYADGGWSELDDCSVDTSTNTITCEAPHFSVFAIFGSSSSSGGSSGSASTVGSYGGSVRSRVANLVAMGRIAEANALKAQWPWIFVQKETISLGARDLYFGTTGEDVRALQTLLINNGYEIPAGATGSFFIQTKKALVAYQRDNGIYPAVGYMGPVTRAHMKTKKLQGLWW